MCVGERPLPGLADGLYSEAVAAGLHQPLHLVGVAGAVVNGHEPARGQRGGGEDGESGEKIVIGKKGVNRIKEKVREERWHRE